MPRYYLGKAARWSSLTKRFFEQYKSCRHFSGSWINAQQTGWHAKQLYTLNRRPAWRDDQLLNRVRCRLAELHSCRIANLLKGRYWNDHCLLTVVDHNA